MLDVVLTVAGFLVTGAFGLIGWVMKMIFDKFKEHDDDIEANRKALDAHKLHAAENFAVKLDIRDMENKLVSHLVRIEEKLDKKADKP